MLQATSSTSTSSISSSTPHDTHPYPQFFHLIGWKLPHGGFIKINFDDSKSIAGAAAGLFSVTGKEGSLRLVHAFWSMPQFLLLKPRQ